MTQEFDGRGSEALVPPRPPHLLVNTSILNPLLLPRVASSSSSSGRAILLVSLASWRRGETISGAGIVFSRLLYFKIFLLFFQATCLLYLLSLSLSLVLITSNSALISNHS